MSKNKLSKRLLALSAALTLSLAQGAWAAEGEVAPQVEEQVVTITLEEAMLRAFNTNPAIAIAGYERAAAKADYDAARSSRWVNIKGDSTFKRGGMDDDQFARGSHIDEHGNITYTPVLNVGTQIREEYSNTLSASMPIYTGGRLSGSIKAAKAGFKYALVGEQKAYNDMRATVTNGYYGLLQAGNMRELGRESVHRLEEHLKDVKAQYDVGVVAKVDVLRSEVELANAQQSLIKAENGYQLAEASLNRIIGLPLNTRLQLIQTLDYVPYDIDLDYCLDYAITNRPELEQARQGIEAAHGSLLVARSGYQPQVGVSASKSWSDKEWPGDENGNWGVGVGVSMNIFDSGVTMSKIHGAKADLAKAEETYRDTNDAVMLHVRQSYLNMREAEKRIQTTQVAVSKAEEDYHIAQVRYMAGVGTNTDVLDAQVALTNAKTNYTQALYDYNTSKTDLQNAIGEPMLFPKNITVEPAAEDKKAEAAAEDAPEAKSEQAAPAEEASAAE